MLRNCLLTMTVVTVMTFRPLAAQEPASGTSEKPSPNLSTVEQQLYRDYERFEKSLFDVAEQARRADPERAQLLYRARSQSQEQNILAEMQTIAELLRAQDAAGKPSSPQFGPAVDRQKELLVRMESVLKLLQSLDERARLTAEIERIQALLKDTNRLIARQKDVRAQTERSPQTESSRQAQQRVAKEAEALHSKIETQDEQRQQETESNSDTRSSEDSDDEQSPGKPSDQSQKSGDQKSDSKSSENKSSGKPSGDKSSEQKPSEGKPSGGKSSSQDQKSNPSGQKSPSHGKPQSSPRQQGSQQQSPQGQQESPPQDSQQTPGREQLEQARQKMQQAIEQLEQQQKDQAIDEQDDAVTRLEEMKAQLEEILRQLREDEKESYLTLLEARFQNMLKRQERINSETIRLNSIPEADRAQQNYASQTDKIRKEQEDNALEAAKALHLLKEEGSSVAFPEAVEQTHRNMEVVVARLLQQDTGATTQLVEQLIVETLDELITAFRKELQKKQEDQKSPPSQQGQPQDPSLVNQLAELKLIRSLQNQVNRLTKQIGTELEGRPPQDSAQIELIEDLRTRQERIQRATYDLSVGRNK